MASKVDNGAMRWKQALRLGALSGRDGLLVLDCFAGEGGLYRGVWARHAAPGSACIDKVPEKVTAAAEERTGWACVCGDSVRALEAGLLSDVAWDVVDLDVYGSPWPALRAWMTSERRRAARTEVFLTDGYMRQASLVSPCKTLFPAKVERFTVSPNLYRATVATRIEEWRAVHGLRIVDHQVHKAKRLRLHRLVVEA